jgi:class 3 adenylate cyclase/tetratricopeptide (TPR) repeat protein
MSIEIAAWLRGLGLEQYTATFRDNDIDAAVLPRLTAEDLCELGVASVGHRRRLLDAIAALGASTPAADAQPGLPGETTTTLAPRGEAERRQLTVVFCDLAGSTELSVQLDPEDLRELIGAYRRAVADVVRSFDGFVAKYMGDGVLVYFGYPRAHEDDSEQAVRAGLGVLDAVRRLDAKSRKLQARVGIATGLVVVGDLIGEGAAQEQAVVGETPNLAARLQALAEPDAVVIAESTRRQIGNWFEVSDLGTQSLKGFAEPQRVWRVLRENLALGQFEALRSGATPLVGRDDEMDLLLRRWAQAKAGRGDVVLMAGEPGVGKSRLTEAFAERIGAQPHIRLRYFCSPHHQDSAFHPIIVQTERAADFLREDTPGGKLAKLEALLADTAPRSGDVALIAALHGLSSTDIALPLDASPQRNREKTLEVLLRRIEGLSHQQPVLMVFEDIHWIDPSSHELLDRTIERIANWRVLLVATFRHEFQPPWIGQPRVTTIALTRLDRHETEVMVANIAGNTLPSETVREIAERTDGIPLFVEELTKAVLESGVQSPLGLSSVQHPASSVPATLHASLMARLDRLGAVAKDVAQTGAAIGREFSYELLLSLVDMPGSQLPEALDSLVNAGLLLARGVPPHSTYIFKHALVQDAAYSTFLRGRRQQLHARIAATLESSFPEIVLAQPELLARHCAEAKLPEKAAVYWLNAGRQALARSAMKEAVVQLRKGLDLLPGLPDGSWRRQQELGLQIALRSALAATQGYGAAVVGQTLARARELAEQIDQPEHLLTLTYGQWQFHWVRSEHRLALTVAEQLERLGETRNDKAIQLLGRRLQGLIRGFLGEFVTALTLIENCHGPSDLAHHEGDGLVGDPHAMRLSYLSLTLVYLGYIDQARSRINEALWWARQRRNAHNQARVLVYAIRIDWVTRSLELEQHTKELLTLSSEHGLSLFEGWATAYRGLSLTARGQTHEGLSLLSQGLESIRAAKTVVTTPGLLVGLAEAHAMVGRPVEGLKYLTEAAQIIETTEERVHEADLYRVRGDLLNAAGDQSAAEQDYRQATAVAQQQSAKLFELRSAASLARLWRDQGKIADARARLAPIYRWFTEGFDAPDLVEAKALLRDLVRA